MFYSLLALVVWPPTAHIVKIATPMIGTVLL